MESDWLVTTSFEQSMDVLAAVNTLAVHTKLRLAGIESPLSPEKIIAARLTILAFLGRVEKNLDDMKKDDRAPILGTNPRLGEFISRLADENRYRSVNSKALFQIPVASLKELMEQVDEQALRTLAEYLDTLRLLLEQHVHADTSRLLGEI